MMDYSWTKKLDPMDWTLRSLEDHQDERPEPWEEETHDALVQLNRVIQTNAILGFLSLNQLRTLLEARDMLSGLFPAPVEEPDVPF